ncbi:MAG: 30S ribosomal protein S2 [Patescibacteria group bacterium]|nr:30S ribosomal protein S2 [Patescibacteria group bacterium]
MVNIPTEEELFEAMVHFGHQARKCHPKMAPYLYTIKNNVHLIDLEKTRQALVKVLDFVKRVVEQNGQILFVGTKPAAQVIVKKYAEEVKMPYIVERWLAGLLTNFSVVSQLIQKLKKMEEEKESGEWDKYPKKERMKLEKELNRLNNFVGGLRNLEKIPEAIYIIDLRYEKTAVREAKKAKIKSIGLVDTNCDPTLVDYPIPGNDDAIKSIEIVTRLITEAIQEGQKEINTVTKNGSVSLLSVDVSDKKNKKLKNKEESKNDATKN